MSQSPVWERFENDPRAPANTALRASNADRDVVNDVLGTAYAEGRITPEEFDERTDQVAVSKTLGELPPIIKDLVSLSGVPARRTTGEFHEEAVSRYESARRHALFAFLTPTLICWAVWAATMFGGFPWPVFVTIATGMRFAQLATSRNTTIRETEQKLQRKELRAIEARERRARERPK